MTDWTSVSRWLSELSDPQAELSESIAARAATLTSGAGTEFQKIQAIGKFAQGVQYVSIQTGIGRGGGYKPHAAKEVLEKQYGDCKDKANLMRAPQGSGNSGLVGLDLFGRPGLCRRWPRLLPAARHGVSDRRSQSSRPKVGNAHDADAS